MASALEQASANGACANSSDGKEGPLNFEPTEQLACTKEENDNSLLEDPEEMDMYASDFSTKYWEDELANDFNTKTWKEDLTLTMEGKQFYVASGLLALVFPIFSSMFKEAFKEERPRVMELQGNDSGFVEFLRCIYPSINKPVTAENALIVAPLAHKYQVERVKKKCEAVLVNLVCSGSSLENLSSFLKCASSCQLTSLRQNCILAMMRCNDSELDTAVNKLQLSSDARLDIEKTKVSALEKNVYKLNQALQEKSNSCADFENLVRHVWLGDLEIDNSKSVELRRIDWEVSDNAEGTTELILIRSITLVFSVKIAESTYYPKKNKELRVDLSATGEPSWRQWTCKVKCSCSVSDGKNTVWKQESANIGSSNNQKWLFKFQHIQDFLEFDLIRSLKGSMIVALGDVLV